MHSNKEEMKVRWYTLTCKPPKVIVINDAWDYLDYCEYYFKNKDMKDLKDQCNGQSSCIYKRSGKWGYCDTWSGYIKSVIQYGCVPNPEIMETTTPVTLPSSEATKVTSFTASYTKFRSSTSSNQNYSTSNGRMSTTSSVTSTRPPLTEHSSKSNDAVIAGSVIGVLGILALILLLIYFVMKRRKADKHKATRPGSVTNAVGQNSNVLYVVSENVPPQRGRIDDEPPAYNTLDNIPDQNHIYHGIGKDLKHQHTNNYNHIHGTVGRNSHQNDDYNHTDTETVNISGGQEDNYNHISVSGRNADDATQMQDGYNHIRGIEGVRSHDIGDYNHFGGQTDDEENRGYMYMEDDYNHLDNSKKENTSEREQPCDKEDGMRERSQDKSKSENDYANIGIKEGNNGINDFEPDDTYVYS